jgi:hypothetical protein
MLVREVLFKRSNLFIGLIAFFLSSLSSCSSSSEEFFQTKVDHQLQQIASLLTEVRCLQDLEDREVILKAHFLQLAEALVLLQAHISEKKHNRPSAAAENLLKELERLYEIEGMRYEVEKIEQPALEKFAAYLTR